MILNGNIDFLFYLENLERRKIEYRRKDLRNY